MLAMVLVYEQDPMQRARDHRLADDETECRQVATLHEGVDRNMYRIGVSPIESVTAPFNPWWLSVQAVS